MRAIKSQVMSLPTSSSTNPRFEIIKKEKFSIFFFFSSDTITEEKVRNLLIQRHHMTFTELIQKFLPKGEHLRTKEIKDGIVKKLADILKRLSIEERKINGKTHIRLKDKWKRFVSWRSLQTLILFQRFQNQINKI